MTTISLRQIYRCRVVDQTGNDIGVIDDVLFHPVEPFAVGFSVKPKRVGGIIPLPTRYLTFSMTEFDDEGNLRIKLDVSGDVGQATIKRESKAAWGAKAERKTGILWDDTVIYYGQDVVTEEGIRLGKISDARFDPETGSIVGMQVSDGPTSDLTLGKRDLQGEWVRGFNASLFAVTVDAQAGQVKYDGGAAQAAGQAAATAEKFANEVAEKTAEVAAQAAEVAIQGAAKAAVYTERALKNAAKTETGVKAKKMFYSFAKSVKNAMDEAREDEKDGS